MTHSAWNRRDWIKTAGALAAASHGFGALAQKPVTVGFIYVGPRDDYGYNQAHAEAAAQVKKMAGVKVVEEENVPETNAVQKTMQGMVAQDGAALLFPTSFGYFDPHILALAPKNTGVGGAAPRGPGGAAPPPPHPRRGGAGAGGGAPPTPRWPARA